MFYSCGLDDENYMDPAENWTDDDWAEFYEENGIEPETDRLPDPPAEIVIPDFVTICQAIAFDSTL